MNLDISNAPDELKKMQHDLFNKANQEWDIGNFEIAFKLFDEAAQAGDRYAPNSLGYFYDKGIGVVSNQEKALFWYKRAARFGDICSYANIGLMYQSLGKIRRAVYWLNKAIDKGDGDAALEIAKIYLSKVNRKSNVLAIQYLQLAAKLASTSEESAEEARKLLKTARP